MEACNAVEKEVDKVITKFTLIHEHSEKTIRDLTNHIEALKKKIDESPPDHELTVAQILIMKQTVNRVRESLHRLAADHKDLHSTVSKVGKAIDKNFISDFASTSREDVFAGAEKIQLLNQVICQHFYRQGMLEIAEELSKEAGIKTEEGGKEPFTELNKILDCLRQHDLAPALEWARARRESLEAQNSSLEFKLHRLHFIGLLQGGLANQNEAVKYARKHFHQFVQRHEKGLLNALNFLLTSICKLEELTLLMEDGPTLHLINLNNEIQNLMGMFLYLPQGLASSPYHYLLDPTLWAEIYEIFTKDACTLLGLSIDSPLSVCINAGCRALPALLNINQVMLQRQVTDIWNGKDELPIEIDLGQENLYHSVFACPILRQQSTESNPPMRLVCGHVISRDALNKLTSGNKLKCPYCPMEQNPADAKLVYF